jgi:GMP synthase (glutamine-hydrolysing)
MRPVLLITHLQHGLFGLVGEALDAAGVPVLRRNLFSDTGLPALDEISAVASLGGQMSVTEIARYPFLTEELELMKGALDAQIPVLGLCLGAQLLALAAGGRVSRMGQPYIGWPQMAFEAGADDDPLFHDLPSGTRIIKWHHDAIDRPPSATVLASTQGPGSAIFRAGTSAWGSQMHLEATPEMLFDNWLPDPVEQNALAQAGLEPDAFLEESRRLLPEQMSAMRIVFDRFAGHVTQKPDRTAGLTQ